MRNIRLLIIINVWLSHWHQEIDLKKNRVTWKFATQMLMISFSFYRREKKFHEKVWNFYMPVKDRKHIINAPLTGNVRSPSSIVFVQSWSNWMKFKALLSFWSLNCSLKSGVFIVSPEKTTYRDYFRRWWRHWRCRWRRPDFLVRSITLSL